ncbi:MAG TPA: DUF2769 domain-containing protein [Methanoregula sp.]|nr:DUF2769 domain-containing protein [Methanoregula sp.]
MALSVKGISVMMDRNEGRNICICRMCPSYRDCHEEIAWCLAPSGKSGCITEEQGCLCPGCPVLEKEGFTHVYYCIRGSEADQHAAR